MARNYTLGSSGSPQQRRRIAKARPQRLDVPYRTAQAKNLNELASRTDANFRHLTFALLNLLEPFLNLFDDQGNLSTLITSEIKKAKSSGIKDVPSVDEVSDNVGGEGVAAGALAAKDSVDLATGEVTNKVAANITNAYDKSADDADDITESATRSYVAPGSVDGGRRIVVVRKTGGDVNVDDVFDTNNNDSDDVSEGTTKKFIGTSGTGTMDDIDDGATWFRVTGVSGATNKVTAAGLGNEAVEAVHMDDDNTNGHNFVTATQEALADYNTDSGPNSEAEWDAV